MIRENEENVEYILDFLLMFAAVCLFFALPVRDAIVVIEGVTIGFVIGSLFGILWAIQVVHSGDVNLNKKFHIAFLFFVIWSAMSVLWAVDAGRVIGQTVQYGYTAAIMIAVYDFVVKRKNGYLLLKAYLLGSLFLVIFTVLPATGMFETTSYRAAGSDMYRVAGLDYNQNNLAMLVTLGVPIAYHFVFNASSIAPFRVSCWVYLLLSPVAVLLTGSRGGAIGLFSMLVVILVFTLVRASKLQKVTVFGAGVGLVLLTMNIIPDRTLNRVLETRHMLQHFDLGNRGPLWEAAISIFWDSPILGVGANNMEALFGNSAHNLFLSISANHGFIGILLILLMLGYVARVSFSSRDRHLWTTLFIGWVFLSMFNQFGFIISLLLFSILLADYDGSYQRSGQLAAV